MQEILLIASLFFAVLLLAAVALLLLRLSRAHREVKESRSQGEVYESICRYANDALFVIDIAGGQILHANPKASEMLGFPLEKLERMTVFDLHAPEMMEKSAEIIADVWERGGMVYQDMPFRTAGGEWLPVECSARVLKVGGKPSIVIYARDIRERLRMEREIREQKEELQEKNKNITDSIRYAERIQAAVLPTAEEVKSLLPESFILFKPRDIVSGDFYWIAPLLTSPPMGGGREGGSSYPARGGGQVVGTFFAVCDCTGHGVPGSLMSMICSRLLTEAVKEKGLTSPAAILDQVRSGIIATLKQRGEIGSQKDGMDAALFSLEFDGPAGRTLAYSGANNPIYIVRKSEERPGLQVHSSAASPAFQAPAFERDGCRLYEIKADRQPVGYDEKGGKPFTSHQIALQQGDMVYAATDGFADQFGGRRGKKYNYSRFKEFLAGLYEYGMEEQKALLNEETEKWKAASEQTDDILVAGIRI